MMKSVQCPECHQYASLPIAIPREASEVEVSCSCGSILGVAMCLRCHGSDYIGMERCSCQSGTLMLVRTIQKMMPDKGEAEKLKFGNRAYKVVKAKKQN